MPVEDNDARLLNIVTSATFADIAANTSLPPTNYVFKENITISSNVVVSDKLTFEPQNGAMFVKSGSGTITFSGIGIAAEDISPYAQVFSGFSPGDVKWGAQMPSEIYATWFGAKPVPGGMSQSATACPTGYDSLPALNVIRDSFTAQIHYNDHLPGNIPFGTTVKFPAGDFCFSAQFNFYNAFKLEGVENNNHWLRATRLLFPANSNGIFVDRYKQGFVKGRANGSFIKNLDIIPYNTGAAIETFTGTFLTDPWGQKITAPAGTFAYPVIDGTMIILPGGIRGFIQRSMRSGSVNGTAFSITNNNQTITVTGAKFITDGVEVGDEVQFVSLVKQVKVTQVVNEETLNVEHISNVDTLGDNVGVASGTTLVSYWILDGDAAYIRALRILVTVSGTTMTMTGGFSPLPAFYNNATVNFIGNNFAPTVTTNGTTMTLSQPLPAEGLPYRHASGAYYVEISIPSGNASVQIYKYAGLRLRNFDWGIVEQVQVRGWRGSGFIAEGSLGANMGQNNMLTLRDCHSDNNNGHGYHYYGTDTHALHIEHPNSTNNAGYAHWDATGTGLTINNGHSAYNYGGIWNPVEATPTQQGNGVNQSTYNDLYFEGGYLGSRLGLHTKYDGGTNALGFQPDSQGASTILQWHTRSGAGSGNRGARLGGAGFLSISPNFEAQHRLWGDPTPNVYPIISGGVGSSVAQNGAFDWSLYNSSEGVEFGTGSDKASGYYIAGLKKSNKSWNTKRLEIGDDTDSAKTAGHFVTVLSGTAVPQGGSYPKGTRVYNINHNGTNVDYWVNTVEGGSTWFAVKPGSVGSLVLYFTDNFNRSDGAVGNDWELVTSGVFGGRKPTIASNRLTATTHGTGAILRPNLLLNTKQEITIISVSNLGGVCLLARYQDATHCYFAEYDSTGGRIYLYNGSISVIGSGITRTPQPNDTMRFTVTDTTLKLEIIAGGVVVATATTTNSTFANAGKCGYADDSAGAIVDDYVLQEL